MKEGEEMRKRFISLIVVMLVVVMLCVGVTVALLVASSKPVVNTFTTGEINILLTESTGTKYDMIPGVTWKKDPTITVKGGSEACWLFVKIEESDMFNAYMNYEVNEEWELLGEETGVYYRQMGETVSDVTLEVLKNNVIHVKDTVREEDLAKIVQPPTLTFAAYAIQLEGNDSAQIAWDNIKVKE